MGRFLFGNFYGFDLEVDFLNHIKEFDEKTGSDLHSEIRQLACQTEPQAKTRSAAVSSSRRRVRNYMCEVAGRSLIGLAVLSVLFWVVGCLGIVYTVGAFLGGISEAFFLGNYRLLYGSAGIAAFSLAAFALAYGLKAIFNRCDAPKEPLAKSASSQVRVDTNAQFDFERFKRSEADIEHDCLVADLFYHLPCGVSIYLQEQSFKSHAFNFAIWQKQLDQLETDIQLTGLNRQGIDWIDLSSEKAKLLNLICSGDDVEGNGFKSNLEIEVEFGDSWIAPCSPWTDSNGCQHIAISLLGNQADLKAWINLLRAAAAFAEAFGGGFFHDDLSTHESSSLLLEQAAYLERLGDVELKWQIEGWDDPEWREASSYRARYKPSQPTDS